MTTAAERLLSLAGTSGTAAVLLLAIGSGASAGAALVDYSGLSSGTAVEHLLTDAVLPAPTFTSASGFVHGGQLTHRRARRAREDDLLWMNA